MRRDDGVLRLLPLAAICLAMAACSSGGGDPLDPVQIKLLSNRADLVSDGDALVQVDLPKGATAGELKVDVDGRDVSQQFSVRPDGRITGLVTGLKDGSNTINATATATGAGTAALMVTNHSHVKIPEHEVRCCGTSPLVFS
jgi:hypothetical protein